MIVEYKDNAIALIVVGTITLIISRFVPKIFGGFPELDIVLVWICSVGGAIAFVSGCTFYAKSKGYHRAWGLLGWFFYLGLLILVIFPDRHK